MKRLPAWAVGLILFVCIVLANAIVPTAHATAVAPESTEPAWLFWVCCVAVSLGGLGAVVISLAFSAPPDPNDLTPLQQRLLAQEAAARCNKHRRRTDRTHAGPGQPDEQ